MSQLIQYHNPLTTTALFFNVILIMILDGKERAVSHYFQVITLHILLNVKIYPPYLLPSFFNSHNILFSSKEMKLHQNFFIPISLHSLHYLSESTNRILNHSVILN